MPKLVVLTIPSGPCLARCVTVQVGTPGRLVDHLSNTKGFSLRSLQYLVSRHVALQCPVSCRSSSAARVPVCAHPSQRGGLLCSARMSAAPPQVLDEVPSNSVTDGFNSAVKHAL